eukprot:GFUD01127201.1.p3 GENE.GFUD01127201.1~~GFUD01127201.1.p3  ORF type:complete len:140 (+),score=35.83 GFUD01127201.1:53-472(+)
MVPLVVHIMVQVMILDIHHSLTIMDLDLDQDEVVTQEAHQEILHSLMDLMALHTAILMGLHMALQLALHMVHLMVILVILEVPTMATGKMVQEDKEIMDMAIEGKTIKVVRRTSEEEGVTLSRTGKKIHAEGIRIEQNL